MLDAFRSSLTIVGPMLDDQKKENNEFVSAISIDCVIFDMFVFSHLTRVFGGLCKSDKNKSRNGAR